MVKTFEEGNSFVDIFKKARIKHDKYPSYFRTSKKLACLTQAPTFLVPYSTPLKFCVTFKQSEIKHQGFCQYYFTLSCALCNQHICRGTAAASPAWKPAQLAQHFTGVYLQTVLGLDAISKPFQRYSSLVANQH